MYVLFSHKEEKTHDIYWKLKEQWIFYVDSNISYLDIQTLYILSHA